MFEFVNILKNHPNFIRFFIQIAEKMKDKGLFKEDINVLVASLVAPTSNSHRKEWLEHEVRRLELQKKTIEDKINENKEPF
ncbi:hypothetical protein BH23THE1_BH23THE1_02220 [soil metagenome]